ncbi:hypothetical protein RRG08_026216 [Elysia crispata]|uniref:Uncharacterized protein n=1 Tax=Elysia crispata TaxID=231223 RepID=A0AAE0ZAR5_9GAST|nr:hypothetical protein RRG08_026216 [Elysia crispata]
MHRKIFGTEKSRSISRRMDIVEAAETNLGKFVPLHLFKFNGDQRLQSNFRQLIEHDYGKGIVKHEFGLCQSCGLPIASTSQIRMKPSRRKTSKVLKLLAKEKSGAVFGKYNNFVLQRYKESCTQLNIRCSNCHSLNMQDLISNEAKQEIKDRILPEAHDAVMSEKLTPSQKKKRRKKKKGRNEEENHSGLILPNLLKIPPMDQDGKQKKQNPQLDLDSGLKLNQSKCDNGTPIKKSKQNCTGQNSKSVKSYPSGTKQTTLPHKKQRSSGTPTSIKKHALNQKDLKQFLQQGQSSTKRASLTDFLSSL